MISIGIVSEANARQKGLRELLSERSLTSLRPPSDGRSAIGDTANTS